VITLLLTHLDAAGVRASLDQFPPHARVVVCHGGRREDFDAVDHADKLFVDDPSLRGPIERQSYDQVLTRAWREVVSGSDADLIYLVEYDHIVLRPDYETALRQAIDHSGADFLGKNCSRRDDTNWTHALRAREDPRMRRFDELWGCLGTGMLFRRAALEAFAGFDHTPGYLELYVPTVLNHLGFETDDVDRFSDLYAHVNAPPEKDLAALKAARSEGHFFVHPFKRVDLLASWP
jgi:hypothetical protein